MEKPLPMTASAFWNGQWGNVWGFLEISTSEWFDEALKEMLFTTEKKQLCVLPFAQRCHNIFSRGIVNSLKITGAFTSGVEEGNMINSDWKKNNIPIYLSTVQCSAGSFVHFGVGLLWRGCVGGLFFVSLFSVLFLNTWNWSQHLPIHTAT